MMIAEQSGQPGRAQLRIVARNDRVVRRDDLARPAPTRFGDGWYHEEAMRQEREALGLPAHPTPRRGGARPDWLKPVGA